MISPYHISVYHGVRNMSPEVKEKYLRLASLHQQKAAEQYATARWFMMQADVATDEEARVDHLDAASTHQMLAGYEYSYSAAYLELINNSIGGDA